MKYKTHALTQRTLSLFVLVAILAAFSPSSTVPVYAQTQNTDVQRPGIPTAMSVSVIDHDSLRITWSAPTSGGTPTAFDLQYRVSGSDSWTTVENVTSAYVLESLTPNTKYTVQVRAKNSAGASRWSGKGKGKTQATVSLPSIPAAPTVSAIDHDSLQVTWSAPTSGGTASGYDLQYRVSGSDSWTTVENAASPRTLDGLTPNTKYTVQVRAKNSAGASRWSGKGKGKTQATVSLPSIPAAPTVSAIDHDSLQVTWSAPTSGGTASGYDLQYRVSGSDSWTTVENAASPRTLDGLTPNTKYTVQVRAKNGAGTSRWSGKGKGKTQAVQSELGPVGQVDEELGNVDSEGTTQTPTPTPTPTATPAPTLPGVPAAPTVSVIDHDSLRITWSAPTSGGTASGYDLRYKVADNTTWITVADVSSPYTLNGLTSNTTYHVQVLAKNSAGTTKSDRKKATTQAQQPAQTATPTPTATATPAPTLPGAPSAPTVSVIDHDSLRVTWSAPTSGGTASGYDLRYRVSGSDSWTKVENAASPRTLDDLTQNTRYTVQVRAKNAGGTSRWSGRGKGTTQATVPAPGVPAAPTVSAIDHDSLKVTWSAPTGGGTPSGYDLRYKVAGSDSWTKVENAASPRTLDGLTPNTKYTVQVRAKNAGGTSRWSGRGKGTTQATVPAPGVPAAPTVSAIDHDSLKVTWSAPTGGGTPSGYDLRYKVAGSDSWTTVENAASPRTLDDLTQNTRYTVQVRAKNAGGTSRWSGRGKGTTQAEQSELGPVGQVDEE